MVIADALKKAKEFLLEAGIHDFASDADILLEYVTGYDHTALILNRSNEIKDEVYLKYLELLRRRAEHIPVQYLTGSQEFMGLKFAVNTDVLIPRFDTEILVTEALRHTSGKKVLDMCTGSGCIIISIMKLGKAAYGTGVDISDGALDIARRNAADNETAVEYIKSDMFSNINGTFDIIVSNPPYVTEEEYKGLEPEVRLHEPKTALVGSEEGLAFYKILAEKGRTYLENNGRLIVEIGYDQAVEVRRIFETSGYTDIEVIKDLAGLDRVVSAVKS